MAVDDATGRITRAKFDKNEGVIAVFKFWLECFEQHGLPCSIYLDKFSTYKINHPSAVDNKDLKTQFERVISQVGVKTITAYSPQAKGRVKRMNGTLQDRLVKELRLAGISTIEEANKFLETYIHKFNKQFAVMATQQDNLHKTVDNGLKAQLLLHLINDALADWLIEFNTLRPHESLSMRPPPAVYFSLFYKHRLNTQGVHLKLWNRTPT